MGFSVLNPQKVKHFAEGSTATKLNAALWKIWSPKYRTFIMVSSLYPRIGELFINIADQSSQPPPNLDSNQGFEISRTYSIGHLAHPPKHPETDQIFIVGTIRQSIFQLFGAEKAFSKHPNGYISMKRCFCSTNTRTNSDIATLKVLPHS